MKIREKQEMHRKTLPELKSLVLEIKKALHGALMERAQDKLKNTRLIFLKRKALALTLTIINEKSVLTKKRRY